MEKNKQESPRGRLLGTRFQSDNNTILYYIVSLVQLCENNVTPIFIQRDRKENNLENDKINTV